MKFSEKLQKLRKDNNYNQEQLAEMLDVSRQSVSKWESGQTYPEMDKLLTMCKIFNVTLDDLTNDDIDFKDVKIKNTNMLTNLIDDIMELISKSTNMFKSMNKKEKEKCIGSLLILIIILLLFRIPFSYIIYLVNNLFIYAPRGFYYISFFTRLIINIVYTILFVFIFLYVYKSYFLDKYNLTNKSDNLNTLDNKIDNIIEDKKEIKENIIIKEKRNTLLIILGKIVSFCTKGTLLLLSIPFIIALTILFLIITTIIILFIKYKITYIGIIICSIAGINLTILILKMIFAFIFSKRLSFKVLFTMFITSLALAGIGTGITLMEVTNTEFIYELPKDNQYKLNSFIEEYKFEDNMVIEHEDVNYIIDNNIGDNIKFELSYYDYFVETKINKNKGTIDGKEYTYLIFDYYSKYRSSLFKILFKNLKNKNIYNYGEYYEVLINVYVSEENYNKLMENKKTIDNYYELDASENERLYDEINDLISKNIELEYDKNVLEGKIEDLENKIEEYKNNINLLD